MQALLWHRGMLITTDAKPTRNSWNAHHISIVPELDTSNNKHITTTIWRGNSLLSFTVLTEWQQLTTNLNSKRWANLIIYSVPTRFQHISSQYGQMTYFPFFSILDNWQSQPQTSPRLHLLPHPTENSFTDLIAYRLSNNVTDTRLFPDSSDSIRFWARNLRMEVL